MSEVSTPSNAARWTGYVISVLPCLFLLVDGVTKLFKPAIVVEATTRLGYNENVIVPIGIVLVVCTVLYLVPITSILGAILLTGYLGGAVATHVRVAGPAFSISLPIIIGVLLWGALYLRDYRVRSLIPLRATS